MDNTRDLPGYKYYVDARTGERPELRIAFLDLSPAADAWVNGCVFPVTADQLEQFDNRERNYQRIEVVLSTAGGPLAAFAYFGLDEARRRFDEGRRDQRVAIARDYLERVREAFARLGDYELATFDATTDAAPCPLLELRTVELTE